MTDPVIRPIPLSQLELSPENVRKTPASDSALAELTASITAHGLIGNLVVQAGTPGPNGGRYPVIAGGRRLAALNALVLDGKLEPDYLVPCRIIDNAAIAQELSLAENMVRSDMHPGTRRLRGAAAQTPYRPRTLAHHSRCHRRATALSQGATPSALGAFTYRPGPHPWWHPLDRPPTPRAPRLNGENTTTCELN